MTIRIQYRDQHSGPWTTSVVEASQVPAVGECPAPAPIKVLRVARVLHVLFDAAYDAAELIDFEHVQAKARGEVAWRG